jgi:hypothetical protein
MMTAARKHVGARDRVAHAIKIPNVKQFPPGGKLF